MKTHKYWLKGKNEWVEVVFSVNDKGHLDWPEACTISDYRIYEGDRLTHHYPMQEGLGYPGYEKPPNTPEYYAK